MDTTDTGTLTPPIDIQREPSAPILGPYSATVNMLQETRDVLYPQNPQNYPNMTVYQMPAMPAMVNQSTGDLSGPERTLFSICTRYRSISHVTV